MPRHRTAYRADHPDSTSTMASRWPVPYGEYRPHCSMSCCSSRACDHHAIYVAAVRPDAARLARAASRASARVLSACRRRIPVAFTTAGGQTIGKMVFGLEWSPTERQAFDGVAAAVPWEPSHSALCLGAGCCPLFFTRIAGARSRPPCGHLRRPAARVTPLPSSRADSPRCSVCTFGYVGYFPVAPGTAGSMAGLMVFALLRWLHAAAAVDGTVIRCSSPRACGAARTRNATSARPTPGQA